MSSPGAMAASVDDDVEMHDPERDEEVDGDAIQPHGATDDSSEEEEDDPEEERRIKAGFIVDEEEEEEEEEERRPRKKRRKHKKQSEDSEELDEDDLDLITESTGRKRHPRLQRLRRYSNSPPAASSSKRAVIDSSEDDLDEAANAEDIHNIWDDEERRDGEGDPEDEDLDDFIDWEDEEEGGVGQDDISREERRKQKQRRDDERRKIRSLHPNTLGIDANAWQEMHDVFGNGHDYDIHLNVDDAQFEEEESMMIPKDDMRLHHVFEPSVIKAKMLTDDDDIIRLADIPERMQLATASFSQNWTLISTSDLTEADLNGAALWVTQRISDKKNKSFFSPDGELQYLKGYLVLAVTVVLRHMFLEHLEVPHIWTHKRDQVIHYDFQNRSKQELLNLPELWKIYSLGQKYRALVDRRNALQAIYTRLQITDKYFEEEILPQTDGVEVVADASEWLSMMHKDDKADTGFHFHDDEEMDAPKKHKTPSRISVYEVTKKTIVARLAQGFGIKPQEVVTNFMAMSHVHFIDNLELTPMPYAEQFVDSDPAKAVPAEELLRQARMIFATELGKDPILRNYVRQHFKMDAVITVLPTEKGKIKIDEHSYRYILTHSAELQILMNKPVNEMLTSSQFLRILDAENQHLISVSVLLPPDSQSVLERRLSDAFTSDSFDESAKAWNEERSLIVQEVLVQHLLPMGSKWVREYLRDEVEDFVANSCASALRRRVDVAPYRTPEMAFGETASVMAMSWGKGDPQRDDINIVYLDEGGRLREQTKIDNLYDQAMRDEFFDLIKRRRPDVIVVGGFTIATAKLSARLKELLRAGPNPDPNNLGAPPDPDFQIPVIYVRDEVARIFQHSPRAVEEFGPIPEVAKYCIGMARFVQNPLNEYAALGADISAISFDKDDQHLVPHEKLLIAFERVLVDITNKVGVDINRATTDNHYKHLLPFVCGLGLRKAEALIQKIQSLGGNLADRNQFLKNDLLTHDVFLNAAGFLRIYQESTSRQSRRDDENVQDPLDSTRIHPADYELARKMATDALEMDEEDVQDGHPSQVVTELMKDPTKEKRLAELNLDDFAISLYEVNHEQKRHTLNVLRAELLHPFSEQRNPWTPLSAWDVLTMLSTESEDTLTVGLIVPVQVNRGLVTQAFMSDDGSQLKVASAVNGVILDVKLDLEADQFLVELSTRRTDMIEGDSNFRRIRPDPHWDAAQNEKDLDILARKKRAETAGGRRIIKHPNFHNFNTAQAEAYLEKQQRGDVVIRPSSKGNDHLAVTWKVDHKLYQHIDVTDSNPDPSGQALGGQLVVDAQHIYSDLDELIVNHVQAMVRRVEELMNHERFKAKSEDELHQFLKQQLAANPAKSMYGFTLNRKRPGHFTLCFLANKQAAVQSWPVRVTPEAYFLPELCDAFKVRHLHQQSIGNQGGRTPFGAGMRTPARPTGGMTPGRPGYTSVRQPAATPNPYGGATPASRFGNAPPQTAYGYQTPSHPAPGHLPAGMNPQRAAMIQDANGPGWGR
ncbi:SH2 domain-containing protein [Mucidula mucida]|nr:SH2 domain-containing protein [Mucidula mucida]